MLKDEDQPETKSEVKTQITDDKMVADSMLGELEALMTKPPPDRRYDRKVK